MPGFSAGVDSWIASRKDWLDRVFKQSAQEVIEVVQAKVPVDTGFCRATAQVSTTEMPSINPDATNEAKEIYVWDPDPVVLAIAGAMSGQTIFFGYTAAYAPRLEFEGYSRQAPEGFVRLGAQQWPDIVARNASRLASEIGG